MHAEKLLSDITMNPFDTLPTETAHAILVTHLHDACEEERHQYTTLCVVPFVCKRFYHIVRGDSRLREHRAVGLSSLMAFFKAMNYASLIEWAKAVKRRVHEEMVENLDEIMHLSPYQSRIKLAPKNKILRGKEYTIAKYSLIHGKPKVFCHFVGKVLCQHAPRRREADKLFNCAMAHGKFDAALALLEHRSGSKIMCSHEHLDIARECHSDRLVEMIKARVVQDMRRIFRRAVVDADLDKVKQMIAKYGFDLQGIVHPGEHMAFLQESINNLRKVCSNEFVYLNGKDHMAVMRYLFDTYPTLSVSPWLLIFGAGMFKPDDFQWAWHAYFDALRRSENDTTLMVCQEEEEEENGGDDNVDVIDEAFKEACYRLNADNLKFIAQHNQVDNLDIAEMLYEMEPEGRYNFDAALFIVDIYRWAIEQGVSVDVCDFVKHCIKNDMEDELCHYLCHVELDEYDIQYIIAYAIEEESGSMLDLLLHPEDEQDKIAFGHFVESLDDEMMNAAQELIDLHASFKSACMNRNDFSGIGDT